MSTQVDSSRQWSSVDKAGWPAGPWQDEPDKMQWVDEATGLDCLIVRNGGGALCGYVGVPEGHPFFGVDYDNARPSCSCEDRTAEFHYCESSYLSVHGGLTFSDFCQEATRETWERWRTSMHARRKEAADFPLGDSARAWKERGHLMDDFDAWLQHHEAASICHVPLPGRPERVWWLGFDCAHAGDYSPKYDADTRYLGLGSFRDGVYRDIAYVRAECASLASQIKRVEVQP